MLRRIAVSPRMRSYIAHIRYSIWLAAVISFVVVSLVALLRQFLQVILQADVTVSIFLIAVVISSMVGGLLSGSLAILLSFLIHGNFLVYPNQSFDTPTKEGLIRLVLFLLEGTAIVLIIESMHISRQNEIDRLSKLALREKELELVNQKVLSILESITDAFFAVDKKWRFTYINARAEQIYQRKKEVLLGKVIWNVLPLIVDTQFEREYRWARKHKQAVHFEAYFKPSACWYEVHVYPSKDGLSVYLDDVTKRKELERQKDEFLGIVSHELKTPVTSIKAFSQLLERRFRKSGDPKSAQILHSIDQQTNKLTMFINDLLDGARLQSGKMQFQMQTFNFDDLVNETVKNIQSTTLEYKITITGKANVMIRSDPQRLMQVMTNFLTNAIKYSPDNTVVDVNVSVSNKEIQYSVTDYGIGIPAEYQQNLFTRFYRVEKTSADIPGVGLGLYIAAEIVRRLGGKIGVKSEEGKGSTFFFSLPY